ncbi:MAG: hypothetical protein ABI091_12180 [Ferruginibacter sp.]
MLPEKTKFFKDVSIAYSIFSYKVRENINLIEEVIREIREKELQGVKYNVHLMGENVYIHIAQFTSDEANKKFTELASFKNFKNSIKDRLEEKVLINDIEEIGSYTAPRLRT